MNPSARPVAVALLIAATRWLDDIDDPPCRRQNAPPPAPPIAPAVEPSTEATAPHRAPVLLHAEGH